MAQEKNPGKATAKSAAKLTVVNVVMVRPAPCGARKLKAGDMLARVQLQEEVSLNFLVDAVRNCLAGERPG